MVFGLGELNSGSRERGADKTEQLFGIRGEGNIIISPARRDGTSGALPRQAAAVEKKHPFTVHRVTRGTTAVMGEHRISRGLQSAARNDVS